MKTKKILALLLVSCMIFALTAACNSDGGDGDVVELRVLNYFDLTTPNAIDELEVIWNAFDEAHPNITITLENEFEEPFHQATEAYAAAGTLPDVLYVWPSGRSTTLHTNGLLKDLTPLIERDGIASQYLPSTIDPSNLLSGYLSMLPQGGGTATNIFIVNTEVLDEVGLTPAKTYSELVAQVPILREAGYDTICMPNESDWVMQSCLFSLVAGRFMGEAWEQRILSGETSFLDPNFIAALEFIKTMYDDEVIPQSSLAMSYGEGPGLFANNTAAYYIDGDWRIGDFLTDGTTGVALIDPDRQDKFIVTVFPEIDVPGVKIPARTNSVVMSDGWAINANLEDGSPELEAAWELVKWLTGKEVMSYRLQIGAIGAPARTDIDIDALPLEPLMKSVLNLGSEYDVATAVIDGVFEGPVYPPLNEGLQAIGLGISTPQEVAEITQAALEAWAATQ